jgi:hypothetical protein
MPKAVVKLPGHHPLGLFSEIPAPDLDSSLRDPRGRSQWIVDSAAGERHASNCNVSRTSVVCDRAAHYDNDPSDDHDDPSNDHDVNHYLDNHHNGADHHNQFRRNYDDNIHHNFDHHDSSTNDDDHASDDDHNDRHKADCLSLANAR